MEYNLFKLFTSPQNDCIKTYKMTRRKLHMDEATINAAFRLTFEPDNDVIKDGSFVFGGFGVCPIFATETVKEISGR